MGFDTLSFVGWPGSTSLRADEVSGGGGLALVVVVEEVTYGEAPDWGPSARFIPRLGPACMPVAV